MRYHNARFRKLSPEERVFVIEGVNDDGGSMRIVGHLQGSTDRETLAVIHDPGWYDVKMIRLPAKLYRWTQTIVGSFERKSHLMPHRKRFFTLDQVVILERR